MNHGEMPSAGELGDARHGGWTGTAAFTAPFAVFVGLMALESVAGFPLVWAYPLRGAATVLALFVFSRRAFSQRPSALMGSVAIGVMVFLIWIGPDILFGAAYRHSWLFENAILGRAESLAGASLRANPPFIVVRILGCVAVVPVVEELFWRGWMMRWLIGQDFRGVPLGAYAPAAFWITAALFACEHGPYWDVGLAAGIAYNWWMIRTRNLADCIVAHAVTNALLSAYVLASGNWQYWL